MACSVWPVGILLTYKTLGFRIKEQLRSARADADARAGIAGYTVWSNLYLSAGAFLFVEPDSGPSPLSKKLPGTRQILSGARKPGGGYGAAEEDRWRIAAQEVASGELEKRAVYLRGITVGHAFDNALLHRASWRVGSGV